jgi:hypothetical protein
MERGKSKTELLDIGQYEYALLDQIKAASYTFEVIKEFEQNGGIDESLVAIKETDVFRLRRGLCLPSAAATCINWVMRRRVIGDSRGCIKIGDFYRLLIPFHQSRNFNSKKILNLEKGWLFATSEGDVYHHAVVAFSRALGVSAISVNGFNTILEFRSLFRQGGAMSLSLDNRFVIDHTLKRDKRLIKKENGRWRILIEGSEGLGFREFEEGRHVVSLLEISDNGLVTILDSFRLPQMPVQKMIMRLNYQEVDKYLNYKTGEVTRGILFAGDNCILEEWRKRMVDVFVPSEIVETIKRELDLIGSG